MRILVFFSFLFVFSSSFAQVSKTFFGQAKLNLLNKEQITSLEVEIRKNPNVHVFRIDPTNGQVFMLTEQISIWTENDFLALFGQNAEKVSCVYIGVYGHDQLKKHPFSDCK
jgi:hypothetical protein